MKNNFTLLEIVICITILAVAGVTMSWQTRDLLKAHHFEKNVENFITDLRKCQVIALSDRVDIEMRIQKKKNTYFYFLYSDDPIPSFVKAPMKMKGVSRIQKDRKTIEAQTLTIFSSGRIEPKEAITFYQDGEKGISLQLENSPMINLRRYNEDHESKI